MKDNKIKSKMKIELSRHRIHILINYKFKSMNHPNKIMNESQVIQALARKQNLIYKTIIKKTSNLINLKMKKEDHLLKKTTPITLIS